jgi:phage/plasmid-associated DNA primase
MKCLDFDEEAVDTLSESTGDEGFPVAGISKVNSEQPQEAVQMDAREMVSRINGNPEGVLSKPEFIEVLAEAKFERPDDFIEQIWNIVYIPTETKRNAEESIDAKIAELYPGQAIPVWSVEPLKITCKEDLKDRAFLARFRELDPVDREEIIIAFMKTSKIGKKAIKDTIKASIAKIWPESCSSCGCVSALSDMIALEILNNNKLCTVKESGTILKFENGGWSEMSEIELKATAQEIGGKTGVTNKDIEEVVGRIKRDKLISMEDFERRPELFMDANGDVFNAITRQFEEVTDSNVTVIHKIGAVFNPTIKPPKEFLDVVELIIPDEMERKTLQEHVGSCLYRKMLYDKSIIIYGKTRNGKTTFMQIIEAVLGEANTATISLQELSKNFRLYTLWRKLFNFMDELPPDAVRNTSAFKTLQGGGRTTIEQKYGIPFEASLYAKSIFAANLLPMAANKDDDGYYSRIIVLHAPNTFLTEEQIGPDGLQDGEYNADPNLVDEIISNPDNLSGILNWMLEGLARLNEQKGYSLKLTLEENKARYDAMAAPEGELGKFIDMICYRDYSGNGGVRKADLKAMYEVYCRVAKIPSPSMQEFNKTLKIIGHNPDYRKIDYTEKPVYASYDAKYKSPYLIKTLKLKDGWQTIMEDLQRLADGADPTAPRPEDPVLEQPEPDGGQEVDGTEDIFKNSGDGQTEFK